VNSMSVSVTSDAAILGVMSSVTWPT
jgi:hypothetical protein